MNLLQMLVENFNQDILHIQPRPIGLMGVDEFKLSLHQLREEIDELEEAYNEGNLVKVVDALTDLDYFQKGILYKHGIRMDKYVDIFIAVHLANMNKNKGTKDERKGYGESADAMKPNNWVSPEESIAKILGIDL